MINENFVTNPMTQTLDTNFHSILNVPKGDSPNDVATMKNVTELPVQTTDWHIGTSSNHRRIKWVTAGVNTHDSVNYGQVRELEERIGKMEDGLGKLAKLISDLMSK